MTENLGKCQRSIFRDYPTGTKVVGAPCMAWEWKDGLCERHHPETKRKTLLRQIDRLKQQIAMKEKELAAIVLPNAQHEP